MTLRLITGAANAGKTGLAYAALKEQLAAGLRPVLLLPSGPDTERALTELSASSPTGLRCMTFDRYIGDAWDQFGDGRAIISQDQRELLCAAAARRAHATPGIASLISRCAEQLAEQTGFGWREGAGQDRGPGVLLSRSITEYALALELNELVERAEATHWLARYHPVAQALVLHRFTDFSLSQETLIREYGARGSVVVTVTYEPDSAATIAAVALIERMGPAERIHVPSGAFDADETLEALARGLFSPPPRLDPANAVRFSLGEGHDAEAQLITEAVRAALLEETASSPERIAVVFRDPERHFSTLQQAFSDAGIAADFDVRRPFGLVSFGSAVRHLIGFALAGERAELLALLRSGFSGLGREQCREVERRWRAGSVSDAGRMLEEVSRLSPQLVSAITCARASNRPTLDVDDLRRLAQGIEALFVLGYGRTGIDSGPQEEADAWAYSAALRVLSQAAFVEAGQLTLRDVLSALEGLRMGPGAAERPGRVQVTSVTRARGRRFDTVILGGLNAGEFPHTPNEDMLPGSAVDDVLRAFGGSGETALGAEFEQYLFYSVVTRAKKRLVLSARSTDDDGEPAAISPFFEIAGDSFRDQDSEESMFPHTYRSLSQAPTADEGAGEREKRRAAALRGERNGARLVGAANRAAGRAVGIDDERLVESLSQRDVFSASEIETYLQCPYGWFYSYAVRPRELEREFGAAEEGSYAHELLRRAYVSLLETGEIPVTPAVLDRALDTLRRASTELDKASGAAPDISQRLSRVRAMRWAESTIRQDAEMFAGFRPQYLEWEFGTEEGVDVGSFRLRGRVDRVDVDDEGRAIVMDYKRSAVPKAADILEAGKVQIPLYFKAVEAVLGLEPIAGLYRSLAKTSVRGLIRSGELSPTGITSTDIKSADEFAEIIEGGLALSAEAVEGMRSGRIACEPRKSASCTYCGAALFCGGCR